MTLDEAQYIAFKLLNRHSKKITIEEIYNALALLANFYEDEKRFYLKTIKERKNKCLKKQ